MKVMISFFSFSLWWMQKADMSYKNVCIARAKAERLAGALRYANLFEGIVTRIESDPKPEGS